MSADPEKPIPALALWSLCFCYFTLGIGSLSVIGLAAPMSAGLGVSEASIAFQVTAFALTYAVCAPLAQILVGDWDRLLLVVIGLGGISVGAAMCAFAPSFQVLVVARILMALGASLVGPMSSSLGASLVGPEQRGRALGIVFTGMPISTVVGVPLTAFLGVTIGWRGTMALIAGLSFFVALLVTINVPAGSRSARITPGDLISVLSDKVLAPAISLTLLQMAAIFTTYSVIGLYLTTTSGLPRDWLSFALFIFGTGGIAGNILATRLTGRFGPDRIITFSLSSLGMIFAVLALWAPPLIPAMGLFIVWAICGMMLYVPQQTRLISLKPQAQNLILALNAAALYVGMAGGSALAGFLTTRYDIAVLPLGSLILVLVALAAFWLSWRQARSTLSGEAA